MVYTESTEASVPGAMVSLFTGAMGLDLGFELAGFETKVIVENDRAAVETIKANRPQVPVIMRQWKQGMRPASIGEVSTEELLLTAGLGVGETTVVIGAPPCEPYSTAGRRNGKADHRADGMMEFIRVINEAKPRYFVLEEVDSFLSAAVRHIPFYDRIRIHEDNLAREERLGSFFDEVMAAFAATGYALSFDPRNPKASVLNAADFGVAQNRKRFILIGTREGPPVQLPSPRTLKPKTLGQVLDDLNDPSPEYKDFPQAWGQYLRLVPPGGCWRDLPQDLQRVVLGGAYDDLDNPLTRGKKGGRTGFMRRLSREVPAPTLVDSPTTKAACMCHPDETRPLSIKEYAALQGFPSDWHFCGPVSARYRLIGQATPVPLAQALAQAIKRHMDEEWY
jgi:DNA (cytosine-5)-methyltransferase 1